MTPAGFAYLAQRMQQKNEITKDQLLSIVDHIHASIEGRPDQAEYIQVKQQLDKISE